jgi:hypothetical protein
VAKVTSPVDELRPYKILGKKKIEMVRPDINTVKNNKPFPCSSGNKTILWLKSDLMAKKIREEFNMAAVTRQIISHIIRVWEVLNNRFIIDLRTINAAMKMKKREAAALKIKYSVKEMIGNSI